MSSINPPSFELPDDFHNNRDRYELWSIRVPVNLDIECLDNVKLQMKNGLGGDEDSDHRGGIVGQHISEFKINEKMLAFSKGHSIETESYRILLRKDHDDDKSNEESVEGEENSFLMKAIPSPFDKHINISEIAGYGQTETDYAPSTERAVAPSQNVKGMRIAYSDIPQATGLKRRWTPIGSNVTNIESSLYQKNKKIKEHLHQTAITKSAATVASVARTPKEKSSERKSKKSAKKSSKKSAKKSRRASSS